jgi:hypothetical protein
MRRDPAASLKHRVKDAAHVANACNAVGNKKGKDKVTAVLRGVIEVNVGVHVPQSRDEVLTVGINGLNRMLPTPADGRNTIAVDSHRAIGSSFSSNRVNDSYVDNAECLRPGSNRQRQQKEKFSKASHNAIVYQRATP